MRGAESDGGDPRILATVEAYDACPEAYQAQWLDHRPRAALRRFSRVAGRGARVLDVACGPALDVRALRDAGLLVVAGDRAPAVVAHAALLHPKRPLAVWDFRCLPFADQTFGGIWAPAALQHVERARLRRAFAEIRRVHAAGPIFVTFREGDGDLAALEDGPAGAVHITSIAADQLKALLLDQRYRDVEVERHPDPLGRPGIVWLHGWGLLPG